MQIGTSHCNNCTDELETTLHALRDCPLVLVIWMNLVRVDCRGEFFDSSLDDWITLNMSRHCGIDTEMDWKAVWANASHMIWMWRNKEHHDEDFVRP